MGERQKRIVTLAEGVCPLNFAKLLPFMMQIGDQYCRKDLNFPDSSHLPVSTGRALDFTISVPQASCIRWKRQDFANPIILTVTHCPCPCGIVELCAFRLCHGCRTIGINGKPVYIGKPLCFAYFDSVTIDIGDHAL